MKIPSVMISQIILIISIICGYFLIDFNVLEKKIQGKGRFIEQNKDCDLRQGPCQIIIEDNTKLTLEVYPKKPPLMEKIKFQVKSSNSKIENLSLKIYSTNMNMGTYELPLVKSSDGIYETVSTLPACRIDDMKWNLDIEKVSLFNIIGARFNF